MFFKTSLEDVKCTYEGTEKAKTIFLKGVLNKSIEMVVYQLKFKPLDSRKKEFLMYAINMGEGISYCNLENALTQTVNSFLVDLNIVDRKNAVYVLQSDDELLSEFKKKCRKHINDTFLIDRQKDEINNLLFLECLVNLYLLTVMISSPELDFGESVNCAITMSKYCDMIECPIDVENNGLVRNIGTEVIVSIPSNSIQHSSTFDKCEELMQRIFKRLNERVSKIFN